MKTFSEFINEAKKRSEKPYSDWSMADFMNDASSSETKSRKKKAADKKAAAKKEESK